MINAKNGTKTGLAKQYINQSIRQFIETLRHWHPELKDFTVVDKTYG